MHQIQYQRERKLRREAQRLQQEAQDNFRKANELMQQVLKEHPELPEGNDQVKEENNEGTKSVH